MTKCLCSFFGYKLQNINLYKESMGQGVGFEIWWLWSFLCNGAFKKRGGETFQSMVSTVFRMFFGISIGVSFMKVKWLLLGYQSWNRPNDIVLWLESLSLINVFLPWLFMKLIHPSWSTSNLAHFPSVWRNVGNINYQAIVGCNNWNPSCSRATIHS